MAQTSARFKINNLNSTLQPFQFENLPSDRNDEIWSRIEIIYGLSLEELSALKNSRCTQGNLIFHLLPQCVIHVFELF